MSCHQDHPASGRGSRWEPTAWVLTPCLSVGSDLEQVPGPSGRWFSGAGGGCGNGSNVRERTDPSPAAARGRPEGWTPGSGAGVPDLTSAATRGGVEVEGPGPGEAGVPAGVWAGRGPVPQPRPAWNPRRPLPGPRRPPPRGAGRGSYLPVMMAAHAEPGPPRDP